jgi:hypothetical protein
MCVPTEERVSLGEARVEAAARAMRTTAVVEPLWRSSKFWTAAIVLALFPFLFILDDIVELRMSPVLPGLTLLFLLILGLPFGLMEIRGRRYLRKDADWQEKNALKAVGVARAAFTVAAVWLLLWFMVGT